MGLLLISLLILAACTDYVQKMDDGFDEWEQAQTQITTSSSSQTETSSSSVKSKNSSSSVILSGDSREKSSSSTKKNVSSSSNKNTSSSSTKLSSSNKASSSSDQKINSSSSVKTISSSSKATSSSSTKSSSSSAKAVSSSSNKKNEVSSSSVNPKISSSGKASWAYLNPAISYGEIIDDRDGQVYKTIKIGEQTWMAENLNYKVENSYCYNDSAKYCEKYGRLYTWAASMDSAGVFSNDGKGCGYSSECVPTYPVRGICPNGYHLPSKEEWEKIFDRLKKENEGDRAWLSTSELDCQCGFDKYGLSILGSAGRDYSGNNFGGASRTAFFQTSSITSNPWTHSYVLYINTEPINATVYASLIEDWSRLYAFSVRCLKNSSNTVLVSSSSAINEVSSSSMGVVPPCKTTTEDNCEYGELKDNRDGQIYKTVKIGNQWWMAENLNYNMANSLCYFDSVKYCAEWGRLYTWTTALQACPHGSHLPSRIEFETLFEAVGGQTTAGKMLKSVSGWSEKNGIDAYSFMALPVGYWDGGYGNAYTIFWSSTEYNDISAYYVLLYHTSDIVNVSNPHKTGAFSVRCIID